MPIWFYFVFSFSVELTKILAIAVYKTLRSLQGMETGDAEETMSSRCSNAGSCATFIEAEESEWFDK